MSSPESFGDSHLDINERALTAVADLIQQVQPGSMTQRFVLLVETIDDEDRWLSAFTAPGQKAWDTMGMLQYGMTMEQNIELGPDEDEDD